MSRLPPPPSTSHSSPQQIDALDDEIGAWLDDCPASLPDAQRARVMAIIEGTEGDP